MPKKTGQLRKGSPRFPLNQWKPYIPKRCLNYFKALACDIFPWDTFAQADDSVI
jgi:hypothetical protein